MSDRVDLDDRDALGRRDPRGVGDLLLAFPRQCRAALGLRASAPLRGHPQLVVVAGMGGSAASGDLLAATTAETVPVIVHRGYGLPGHIGAEALVIASSYSGETVETISALERAIERGIAACAVTSGGRLAALASAHRLPVVTLPGDLLPRFALGYLFFPLLALLGAAGLAGPSPEEIDDAIAQVDQMSVDLGPAVPVAENPAKQLSLAVGDRMPVIYGSQTTSSVAYRWKTDLEENAKRFAVAGALPEMNHNEIEAWRAPEATRLYAILLRIAIDAPEVDRRFTILRAMIEPVAGGLTEVWGRGHARLAQLLSLVAFGQWLSFYSAVHRGIDPWPIPLLDAMKQRLRAQSGAQDWPVSRP